MKVHGFIVGALLAVLAGSAMAENCIFDKEKGKETCNCTDQTVTFHVCTSQQVRVSAGNKAGFSASFPGLTAATEVTYSEETTTGESSCADINVPPNTCVWWEYQFKVCSQFVLVEGFWSDQWVQEITVTYLGNRLMTGPAEPGVC